MEKGTSISCLGLGGPYKALASVMRAGRSAYLAKFGYLARVVKRNKSEVACIEAHNIPVHVGRCHWH
jgi:hypothetical protein